MAALSRKLPWLDRSGRISPLKAAVFAALFLPGLAAAVNLADGAYGGEPAKQVIHALGLWTFRLILLALLVTPAMQIFKLPRLLIVRRMIGVAAFAYGASHLSAYVVQQHFDFAKVGSEIYLRFYLAIGLTALLILLALALTSTDAMIRTLGSRNWKWLHRLVYAAAILALIHYVIQSKLDVTEPTIFGGILIWLMLYRGVLWTAGAKRATAPLVLACLAIAAGALTMIGEAAIYSLFTPIDGARVFDANFSLIAGLRPGWYALLFGLATAAAAVLRFFFIPLRRVAVSST
ncbi:MAG TPA: protein-methionine-sulfoxide reductase heme-binding subunit MsrQ [Rhizomicrobium sp.]|nr:protein-methionine-sulfoxide reductase heme-binding subunit MsrQ [Rhizomicrobium sp.]